MPQEKKLCVELCRAGKLLAEKGLVHSNLGTISLVVSRENRRYLTKPGPVNYLFASPEEFVLVDERGGVLELEKERPSLNFLVHSACYRVRPDIGAVVHAHPRNVVRLVSQKNVRFEDTGKFVFRLLTGEACWFVKPCGPERPQIPIVENLDPKPLAIAITKEILCANVVAIRNHGIVAVGKDIHEALAAALVVEEEAAIIWGIYATGGTPEFLPDGRVMYEVENMPPWFSPPFQKISRKTR